MLLQLFIREIDAELLKTGVQTCQPNRACKSRQNVDKLLLHSRIYLLNLKLSNPQISRTPINCFEFGSCPMEKLILSTSLVNVKETCIISLNKFLSMRYYFSRPNFLFQNTIFLHQTIIKYMTFAMLRYQSNRREQIVFAKASLLPNAATGSSVLEIISSGVTITRLMRASSKLFASHLQHKMVVMHFHLIQRNRGKSP